MRMAVRAMTNMKPILATILVFAICVIAAESYLAFRAAKLEERTPLERAIESIETGCESLIIVFNDPVWEVTCAGCDEIGRFGDFWPSWYTASIYEGWFDDYRRYTGLDRFPFSAVQPDCWGDPQ